MVLFYRHIHCKNTLILEGFHFFFDKNSRAMAEKKMNDSTNTQILQSSTNLHEVNNIVHRIKPVRRHRTCQTIQTVQFLQLTKRSEHQNIDQTRLRIAANKHGIRIMVRLIRLVSIIDSLGNLHSHNRDRMVRRCRLGDTQTNRPLCKQHLPLT